MMRQYAKAAWFAAWILIGWILIGGSGAEVEAAKVKAKNGSTYTGRLGKVGSVGESPLTSGGGAGAIANKLIVLVDDGLRRTYLSTYQVESVEEGLDPQIKIEIPQTVARGNQRVAGVGPIIRVTPLDEYGRRIFSMNLPKGRVDIIQGITEITPRWTRLEGLAAGTQLEWDTRIATSTIPRETLGKIFANHLDLNSPSDRLKIVQFYIQSDRYQDARAELDQAIQDFPDLADLKQQLVEYRQLAAKRRIEEIKRWQSAGQHRLAIRSLQSFDGEGVAGETLLQISQLLDGYKKQKAQGDRVLELLDAHQAAVGDKDLAGNLKPALEEIRTDLNVHTLPRMVDYLRLADDEKLAAEQKLSLAISGWLLGPGAGVENLAVARSLYRTRDLAREYLAAERPAARQELLGKLKQEEGAAAGYLAKLLAHMQPPLEPPQEQAGVPGMFEIAVQGISTDPEFTYLVQLPPEYDPYRRYPTVVSLHGAGTNAELQLDWWAGPYNERLKRRLGQGARRGYIVIAPRWAKPHQSEYEYSARAHAATLKCLRDACRRFSIDTDRVFLSGHSMGGDAAWDIGLAHPDLWAGVIPVVPKNDRYIPRYWQNAKLVPLYFVCGELDGNKMVVNSTEFDRYMKRTGFDVTVVEYLGRGHEHFIDEVQRIFDWMDLHERDFHPQEFEVVSMRPWDNFFWWVELDGYPPASMVNPVLWPPEANVRPSRTEAAVRPSGLSIQSSASRATIYLSPEIVDLDERISIRFNRRTHRLDQEPNAETMLEDARTRGDRQHPFWIKLQLP